MSIIESILWGALQGLTEFIPVSSSGHLVVIPHILGVAAPNLVFNIAVHAGTLLAVIIYFRKDIPKLFTAKKRLGLLVLLATIPVFICGFLFADKIKGFFGYSRYLGWFFVINGCMLLFLHLKLRNRLNMASANSNSTPNIWQALIIGVVQSLALFPGISRSGITITTGVFTGLDREDAYKFSFLLFIPAALLALLFSIKEAAIEGGFNITLLIGALFSALFGLLALKALFFLLKRARLYLFGFYCIVVGLLAIYVF